MENIETKIEQLRKEFNSKLDEILKPKFEVGKWYKAKNIKSNLYNNSLINVIEFNEDGTYNGYGFDYSGNWFNKKNCGDIFTKELIRTEATPKEVEEALIKEAVKRGFKEGVRVDRSIFKNMSLPTTICDENFTSNSNEFIFYEKHNVLRLGNYGIFYNGKWAEIVKTKTIDEVAEELSKLHYSSSYIVYLTENKQDIINALNNL